MNSTVTNEQCEQIIQSVLKKSWESLIEKTFMEDYMVRVESRLRTRRDNDVSENVADLAGPSVQNHVSGASD